MKTARKIKKTEKTLRRRLRAAKLNRTGMWFIPILGWLFIPRLTRTITDLEMKLVDLHLASLNA